MYIGDRELGDSIRIEFDQLVPESYREEYVRVRNIMKSIGVKEDTRNVKTSLEEIEAMTIPTNLQEHYDMVGRNFST